MSEANDQPGVDTSAPGVAAEATADDIDTSAIDRVEAPDEDDAPAEPSEGEEGDKSAEDKPAAAEPELVELEAADGSKHKVPVALKDDFLRQADYTRKTQEIADARRAIETEKQTLQSQREDSLAALPEEYAKVAVVKATVQSAQAAVAEFEQIDWPTWRAQTLALPADDPQRIQYTQYRTAYDAARETAADAQRDLDKASQDLTVKEQKRLETQREALDGELAKARQQTSDALKAVGWDEPRFAKVAQFAVEQLGVKTEELLTATDPRTWRMADEVMSLRDENAKLKTALKQKDTAASNLKAQENKPAEPAKGNAQPTRVRDDVSTAEWIRRRNTQLEKKRA